MTRPCNFCGQNAQSCCARCKVGYCCKEHQRLDWTSHKSVCLPRDSLPQIHQAVVITEEPITTEPKPAEATESTRTETQTQPNADLFVDRVCVVCFSDIKSLERDSCPTHPACNHCLKTWMKECIDTRRIPNLPCVDSTCSFIQPFSLLNSLHGTTVVQKYLDRCAFMCASTIGKFVTCPQCPHLLLLEHGTKIECETLKCRCGVEFCMSCNRKAHPGKCEEFALSKDEQATANFISIYTKPCVSCNWPIQKNGGCHQMTCSQCKKIFCWICSKDVSGDHSACSSKLGEEAAKITHQLAMLDRSTETEIKKRKDLESLFEKRIEGASKQLIYLKHKIATSEKHQQQPPSEAVPTQASS